MSENNSGFDMDDLDSYKPKTVNSILETNKNPYNSPDMMMGATTSV